MKMDEAPPPVPGFERFRWVGAPIYVPIARQWDFRGQLVARGDEAGIVLMAIPEERLGEQVASITLDGAFTSWPPRVGELVVHRPVQLYNRPLQVFARPNDEVAVLTNEPFELTWGRAGVNAHEPDLEAVPDALHQVVTTLGTKLGVRQHVPPRGRARRSRVETPGIRVETAVLPHAKGSGTSFELPPRASVAGLAADHVGGAWLACFSTDGGIIYQLDASGLPGPPVRVPYGSGPGGIALASWREGFACYVTRRAGVALVVSDGTHMTRVEGLPGGEHDVSMMTHSLLVSKDTCSILLCHQTGSGLQLMRADLSPAVPGEPLPDAWEEDRAAYAASVERRAAEAVKPPLPGWAVETTSDGSVPPRLHTKERILRQVRVRHLLAAFSSLWFGETSSFRGDQRAGAFERHDGSGGVECFVWSEAGLVGTSFDSDLGGPMGEEANAENAPMCFPDLPESLQPLLDEAIRTTDGRISGGLWVTTGADARWRDEGSFGDHFGFYVGTPDALFGPETGQTLLELASLDEVHARLVIALAEKSSMGPDVLTEEEEVVLLTPPAEARDAKPEHVAQTVRALAAVGITWRDAEARVATHLARRTEIALATVGALQVDLLRAAERGDVTAVSAALDAGADIECLAVDGVVPRDDRDLSRLRLMTRAVSSLALAVVRGHEEIVDLLLARGATLEGRPPKPQRPPALVGALLARRGALFVRLAALAPDLDADAMLHTHVHRGHPTTIEVVRFLLERGANPRTGAEVRGVVEAAKAAGDEGILARFRRPKP